MAGETSLEKEVELALVKGVENAGGRCLKFVPTYNPGMPDRLVLMPGGRCLWVELKRPKGGRLSSLQVFRHRQLRALGFTVDVVKNKDEVNTFLQTRL